jgi:hypothetical protein
VKNPNEFGARNLDFSHAALPCKKRVRNISTF